MTLLRRRRISCQELVALASDYLDGVLDADLTAAIERHLQTCPNCPNYIAQMRLTVDLAGRLRRDDLPHDVVNAFLQA
jgi:anti-sigma factor RsiW